MANRRIYIGAIMAIVIIVILATYYRNPPESETQLVRIGVLTSTVRINASEVFLAGLAIEDINKYCDNNSIPIQFELVSKCAYGRAQEAIEATDEFHDQNVSIVVGYNWGSMLDACDYQSKNYGMIIVSPYSNSPVHRDVYEHIFQLTPITFHQTQVVAKTMIELGFTETIVFMEDFQDASGYLVAEFEKYYEELGGIIIDRVDYILSTDSAHMDNELSKLEKALNGSNAAVFYPENLDFRVFDNLKYHPNLHNYTWFATSDVHSNTTSTLSVYPFLAEIELIHPYLDDTPDQSNEKYREINDLYLQEFGENMTRYSGNMYDAVWLAGLTVIEIGEYNNESFTEAFPIIAKNYSGVSGNCSLDQYGDRAQGNYNIYNYILRGEDVYLSEIGYYNSEPGNDDSIVEEKESYNEIIVYEVDSAELTPLIQESNPYYHIYSHSIYHSFNQTYAREPFLFKLPLTTEKLVIDVAWERYDGVDNITLPSGYVFDLESRLWIDFGYGSGEGIILKIKDIEIEGIPEGHELYEIDMNEHPVYNMKIGPEFYYLGVNTLSTEFTIKIIAMIPKT